MTEGEHSQDAMGNLLFGVAPPPWNTSMSIDMDYGDLPIKKPEQDLLGIDGFVQPWARSVTHCVRPAGWRLRPTVRGDPALFRPFRFNSLCSGYKLP